VLWHLVTAAVTLKACIRLKSPLTHGLYWFLSWFFLSPTSQMPGLFLDQALRNSFICCASLRGIVLLLKSSRKWTTKVKTPYNLVSGYQRFRGNCLALNMEAVWIHCHDPEDRILGSCIADECERTELTYAHHSSGCFVAVTATDLQFVTPEI
jgi:hypothetical protein